MIVYGRVTNSEGMGIVFPEVEAILANAPANTKTEELLFHYTGEIRTISVQIDGTSWEPEIPQTEIIIDAIEEIEQIENVELKALKYFCCIVRTQMFIDENKRVAQFTPIIYLISKGQLNNNLGGCSLAQEGDDFYIVGADAVRKKLGNNGLNFVTAFELNGVGSYSFVTDKDYDVMYVLISKTYPASLNSIPSVAGATLIKSYSTRKGMDGISFGNISCIYELKNVLKGAGITIYSNTAIQYSLASAIVLAN